MTKSKVQVTGRCSELSDTELWDLIPESVGRLSQDGMRLRDKGRSSWKRYTDDGLLITAGLLPRLDTPAVDIPRRLMTDHVNDLCICLHSRQIHSSLLGEPASNPTQPVESVTWIDSRSMSSDGAVTDQCAGTNAAGNPCPCRRMNPVARKSSKHSFKRGDKVMRRSLAQLREGDRVLAGWVHYGNKIRLTAEKGGGPMIVKMTSGPRHYLPDAEAADQSWKDRALVFDTDLGETIPQLGGTPVLVVL